MKKRIISLILAIVLVVPIFGSIASAATVSNYFKQKYASEEAKLAEMTLMVQNDTMELYYCKLSGEIALKNKVTGEIMLSNPYNSADATTDDLKKQYLSIFSITFKSLNGGWEKTYNSYKDSAVYDQIKEPVIYDDGTGFSVTFDLGKKEMVLPYAILDADMQQLFADIRANLEDQEEAEFRIENINIMYDYSDTDQIWLIKSITEKNRLYLQSCFVDAGYTLEKMHEDYLAAGYDNITGILNYGSYKDYNGLGVSYEVPFSVTIDYSLTNDGFNVSVDTEKIVYDSEGYFLLSMSLLPYFGAANQKTDNGYTFLPDGSGTIVRFEDLREKSSTDDIKTSLYGSDYAYYTVSIKNQEQTTLPVFGLANTTGPINNGFIGIIESGDTLASITSANNALFNSIYTSFKLGATDSYDLADSFSSGTNSSNVISVNGGQLFVGKISVKYAMLTPTALAAEKGLDTKYDTSYIGMANYYRDYLVANGSLDKITEVSDYTRIFLEVFGSVQVEEKVLTFPVTVSKELTTFADVIQIHKKLANIGVGNMSFILTGFANGGLNEVYPTYLKWQKVLGGADGYEELMEYAEKNGVEIAPSVNFSYAQSLKNMSGFKYKKTAAKALDGRYTTKREYDASIQMFQRKGGVVISTDSYELAYTKFVKSASKFNIKTLATRALGSDISSDFDEKTGYIYREQAKEGITNMLGLLTGKVTSDQTSVKSEYKLILDAGNAYTLKYASGLLNTSIDSSRLLNTSETVPFLGMVLHGSLEFAGNAINMEGDDRYMFMKALENGANLYYTIAMQNTELLKGTLLYNQYYSVQFDIWKNKIANTYSEYNQVMASKQDKYITEHEFLNEKYGFDVKRVEDGVALNNSRVVRVEYENQEGFIFNYNSYEIQVTYEGITYNIPSISYVSYGMN